MLTFLPVFLLVGRWTFWPRIPRLDHQVDIATHGVWGRIAAAVGRNARRSWVITTIVLLICVAGLTQLKSGGLGISDSFTSTPDAIVGQRIFDAKFNQGAGAPAVIMANITKGDEVIAVVSTVPGVATSPGSVCVEVDYAKLAAARGGHASGPRNGCPRPSLQVSPVNGRIAIDAQLAYRYDTQSAITPSRPYGRRFMPYLVPTPWWAAQPPSTMTPCRHHATIET
jgi:RND superfamily putative drug exporter